MTSAGNNAPLPSLNPLAKQLLMLKNYFRIATRILARNKLYTTINVWWEFGWRVPGRARRM